VDMCKGKRKNDYEAPMTSSLSDCTWLEKEWKFRLSTTWHPSSHFYFFSFHSIHPSHIFLASPLLSFLFFSLSYIYFFLYLLFFFISFFSIHILFLFIFPSLDIFFSFKALNSSFSHMHTIWNFK
jgi:hypothetical protein